jgi:hypothetical protein
VCKSLGCQALTSSLSSKGTLAFRVSTTGRQQTEHNHIEQRIARLAKLLGAFLEKLSVKRLKTSVVDVAVGPMANLNVVTTRPCKVVIVKDMCQRNTEIQDSCLLHAPGP